MKKRIKSILVLFLLISVVSSYASTTGEILKESLLPEVIGRGDTFVALNSGLTSLFYNPAGMKFKEDKKYLLASYHIGFSDVSLITVGYGQKMYGKNIGIGAVYKTVMDFAETYYDLLFLAGYEDNLTIEENTINWGVVIKMYNSKLSTYSIFSPVLDLGITTKISQMENIDIGISIKNIGMSVKYNQIKNNLPLFISGGFNYYIMDTIKGDTQLVAGMSISYYVFDKYYTYNFGIEYSLYKIIKLRAGYIFSNTENFKNKINFGLGATYKGIIFDYSYQPLHIDNVWYHNNFFSLKYKI